MPASKYSDHKRKGLFNGDGIDYIRMRADKHEKIYNMPKQAAHLRMLAKELEMYKETYDLLQEAFDERENKCLKK